jgi:hypothetical protein
MKSPNERLIMAAILDNLSDAVAALNDGADLNALVMGEDSHTVLILSVIACSGEVAELLVMRGADRELRSRFGTAEEYARDVVKLPALAKAIQSNNPHDWVLAREACLEKKQIIEKERLEARGAHPEDRSDGWPGMGEIPYDDREAGGSEPTDIDDEDYFKGPPRR